MKKYHIKVNGETYEVEVEELGRSSTPSLNIVKTVERPVKAGPSAVKESKIQMPKTLTNFPNEVRAPMAGKILSLSVERGQKVSMNQELLILEAMKMENEIYAPIEGVIKEIKVQVDSAVNNGDLLIILE